MPCEKYRDIRFSKDTLSTIETCNRIIEEYQDQGFRLTLRQLYYQLVSRDVIANSQKEYKRLGSIVNDARLAGLIDWLSIEDRTRNLRELPTWDSPADIVKSAAAQFHVDMWKDQQWRPEVWIEKDALVGVIEDVCDEFDVPYFSCRGYTSQSEMWSASQRLLAHISRKQYPLVLHFGDHDPSGMDMTRDIRDRLEMFVGGSKVERLALNADQVERFHPPPNPAKTTDSRYRAYIADFGDESWELDALEPRVISGLIRSALEHLINKPKWNARLNERKKGRDRLEWIAVNWNSLAVRKRKADG